MKIHDEKHGYVVHEACAHSEFKFRRALAHVRLYDNGGKSFDRYTAVYMKEPERSPNTYNARGMSENPYHPQGFGQCCSAMPGRHLGKRITFDELPPDCQRLVRGDMADSY